MNYWHSVIYNKTAVSIAFIRSFQYVNPLKEKNWMVYFWQMKRNSYCNGTQSIPFNNMNDCNLNEIAYCIIAIMLRLITIILGWNVYNLRLNLIKQKVLKPRHRRNIVAFVMFNLFVLHKHLINNIKSIPNWNVMICKLKFAVDLQKKT